jgi:hypothetical protein
MGLAPKKHFQPNSESLRFPKNTLLILTILELYEDSVNLTLFTQGLQPYMAHSDYLISIYLVKEFFC